MPSHKLNRCRAQVSLEYAAVVALVLAASVPVWMLVQDRLDWARYELDTSLAQQAAGEVVRAADWAAVSGYPARRMVEISLPSSTENLTVDGREIVITYRGPAGLSQAYDVSLANLSGSIPALGGKFDVVVGAVEDAPGNVSIYSVD